MLLDTPGYGSVVDAQTNFDLFMRYIGQTFDEKNKKISPFTEVSNNELMRSLVTGKDGNKIIRGWIAGTNSFTTISPWEKQNSLF